MEDGERVGEKQKEKEKKRKRDSQDVEEIGAKDEGMQFIMRCTSD